MESINGRRPNSLSLIKPIAPRRSGLSASRMLMRILWLSCLLLSIFILMAACDSQQEGEVKRGVSKAEEPVASADFGTYHALIIGINEYSQWPRLKFAEPDAKDIRQILVKRYGFASERVTFLSGTKATRSKILGGLRDKLESLGKDDNLLIYYAGHGQLDPLTETGYWIPVEAGLYDESGWIAFSRIKTLLTGSGVKVKSVMVLTDSCYGGALSRSGPTPGHKGPTDDNYQQYQRKLNRLAQKRSRQIIASGGYEQVPDRSDFASLLKQALEENTYPMVDLEYLFFGKVYPKLKFIGQQEPAFARLVSGPDDDGQFVLLQSTAVAETDTPSETGVETTTPAESVAATKTPTEKDPATQPPESDETSPPPESKAILTVRSNVNGDMVYVDGRQQGSTRLDLELAPGLHAVVVEKEGYEVWEEQVELKPGKNVTIRAKLIPIKPKETPAPVIHAFVAEPAHIAGGQSATLHWETEHAEGVEIVGIGKVPLFGSTRVNPGQTAVYEMFAYNDQGRRTRKEVRVTVEARAPSIPAPGIVYFRTSPSSISRGDSATLSWQTENAMAVHIEGIGRVELSGSMPVRPSQSATYILIAENEQGKHIRKEATVAVRVNPPRILSFEADHRTIQKGGATNLHWRVSDAGEVKINGKGVRPSGSLKVTPRQSIRYILTAANKEGGRVSQALAIRVDVPDPQIVSFGGKSPITAGGSSLLTWRTVNTERVEISGIGSVSASGTRQVKPSQTTTYTLVAKNEKGRQVTKKITVKVNRMMVMTEAKILTVNFLPAPAQVSPAHGSVYNHYPRKTTLRWKSVAGAKYYTAEIEYKSGTKWAPLKKQSGLKYDYTFNFVGAQPGRWRVWAVDSAGKSGRASGWREFRYTK